jgi:hypothetical protein
VHQGRLAQLAREAGRTTVQHIAGYERQRRHATLVAVTLDLIADLTDQAIDLFDRLVGAMFRKVEGRHARAFQADGRAINEKVRLYARVGAALIAAREGKQDPFDAITAVIPWDRFRASVAEASVLARSEEFDPYQLLGEHYAGVRRWTPAFLATFTFQGVPAATSLLRAIDLLRDMNDAARSSLPKSAPTGFIRERWARHVLPGGAIDRRYYELCVLSELRDRLRAGDVWVVGSRRYRSFEERLISRETQQELQQSGTLPIAVDADFDRFMAGRRALLDERLAAVELKAKGGLLPDVTLERGVLKITPIEKSTPPGILDMVRTLGAMVDASERAQQLVETFETRLAEARSRAERLPKRPRVFFEEWDDPLISGIGWVSELVEIAGGIDVFAERRHRGAAKDRIVRTEEVVERQPDLIIGSWCGKKFRPERVMAQPGFERTPAVQHQEVYEIKSFMILQPGPAALTDGLAESPNVRRSGPSSEPGSAAPQAAGRS